MQENARQALVEMIRDCGTDIVRMQASFEMYLNQYLLNYPEEKHLIGDAFKVGIPAKILQHAGEENYSEYLENLGPRFAEAAQYSPDESAWVVETWAIALGRTADYVAPRVVDPRTLADEREAEETPERRLVTSSAMAIIVTSGGAIGAALAALFLPLALTGADLSATFLADGPTDAYKKADTEKTQIIAFLVIGLAAAVVGGVGALGGWILGKGAEAPWASFSVACGTAFTMFFIIAFVPLIPVLIKPVIFFASVFGTTYKSAARGGNY